MPLWESNEIYFVACLSVLVTLGVFASLAFFLYRRAIANGQRANEEQAALEKVLLRKEAVPSGPPTKPLIVSPSFSSPNKVPARHLRSGSYSPTHYLSPYHSRQPRRNSSPTSHHTMSLPPHPATLQPPQLKLHHPQQEGTHQEQIEQGHYLQQGNESGTCSSTSSSPSPISSASGSSSSSSSSSGSQKENGAPKKNNKDPTSSRPGLAQHNSQYYGTIPPRRLPPRPTRGGSVAPSETNLFGHPLKCGSGAVLVPYLKHNTLVKGEYVQLPGKDCGEMGDEEEGWQKKERQSHTSGGKWKNCSSSASEIPDDGLRRKLLLQKQFHQQQHNHNQRLTAVAEAPGEQFKTKHSVTEDIPYYISTQ